jgi:hypothetical protein
MHVVVISLCPVIPLSLNNGGRDEFLGGRSNAQAEPEPAITAG